VGFNCCIGGIEGVHMRDFSRLSIHDCKFEVTPVV
jgi:hypothetical protein